MDHYLFWVDSDEDGEEGEASKEGQEAAEESSTVSKHTGEGASAAAAAVPPPAPSPPAHVTEAGHTSVTRRAAPHTSSPTPTSSRAPPTSSRARPTPTAAAPSPLRRHNPEARVAATPVSSRKRKTSVAQPPTQPPTPTKRSRNGTNGTNGKRAHTPAQTKSRRRASASSRQSPPPPSPPQQQPTPPLPPLPPQVSSVSSTGRDEAWRKLVSPTFVAECAAEALASCRLYGVDVLIEDDEGVHPATPVTLTPCHVEKFDEDAMGYLQVAAVDFVERLMDVTTAVNAFRAAVAAGCLTKHFDEDDAFMFALGVHRDEPYASVAAKIHASKYPLPDKGKNGSFSTAELLKFAEDVAPPSTSANTESEDSDTSYDASNDSDESCDSSFEM